MNFEDLMTGYLPTAGESPRLAESIVETVREPLVVLDSDLRVRLANRSFYRTFRVTREETEGVRFFDLGGRQWEMPELRSLLLDVLPRDARVEGFEIEREFSGLGRRIMLLNARRLDDQSGAQEMILLAIEDITERKRAEERLSAREQHFRSLIENSSDAIALFSAEGAILYAGPSTPHTLGYTPEELVGLNAFDLIHKDDHALVAAHLRLVLDRPRVAVDVQARVRHKDGSVRWLEGTFTNLLDEPAVGAIVNNYRDITERRRAEEELRQSEERFQLVARATNDAVYDWDLLTGRVWWNAGFFEMFGYRAEETDPTAEFWTSRIHPDDRERIGREIRDVIEGGSATWSGEYRLRRADGSYAIVFDRGYVWHTGEGRAARLLGSIMDITGRKQIEQQLKLFASRLERSNRELQDFASVASHDLQEPLRKIQAFGDRLKDKCSDSLGEEGRDYLERMQSAAGRMQTLINDLLMFSRVETRAQPFAPVDLSRVAREVASDLEVQVERTGARLEIGELPTVEADPLQMRQLFQNLIGNALKYRRPDRAPVIRVRAAVTKDRGLNPRPGTLSAGQLCQLSVEDNGIGFDEKYLDRIFTVFQRLHGRKEYEGTGVGLAVCRKIAERHGGSITARSAPGCGATFVVTLPAKQTTEAGTE